MRAFARTEAMPHEGHTVWLCALACAERIPCAFDNQLHILPVDDHIPANLVHLVPFGDQITRDIIVRPFFDRLLNLLLAPDSGYLCRYVLMGNPGIGKSWFQGYILWALLKAARRKKKKANFNYKLVL